MLGPLKGKVPDPGTTLRDRLLAAVGLSREEVHELKVGAMESHRRLVRMERDLLVHRDATLSRDEELKALVNAQGLALGRMQHEVAALREVVAALVPPPPAKVLRRGGGRGG